MADKRSYLRKRRSGRIKLELPILVAGTDSTGRCFAVDTQTLVLSRHGAKIRLDYGLVPEQEITVSCLLNGGDAPARVIELIGKQANGYWYGIEFLNESLDFWKVPFPPANNSSWH